MKALRITIITAILLMTVVAVYGQDRQPRALPKEISNLSKEEKRALLNSTNGEIDALNGEVRDLRRAEDRSRQASQASDLENKRCKAASAFDGSECKETDQGKETEENPISDAQKKSQIMAKLKEYIGAVESYNKAWQEWNNADPTNSDLQKDKSGKLADAARKALGYGSQLTGDQNVSPTLKNEVKMANRKMEITNPVSDLEALKSFFENDCEKCVAN